MISSTPFFTILEWKKLDRKIRQSSTPLTLKKSLSKVGRTTPKQIYSIHSPNGLKLRTRFRHGLSHLNEHNVNRNLTMQILYVLTVCS